MSEYNVFVPEYVPLCNKGEEAIIRGLSDIVFPEQNATFHVLDRYAASPHVCNNIHVYPEAWFCARWRNEEFRLGCTWREVRASACAAVRYVLSAHVYPDWVARSPRIIRQLQSGLEQLQRNRNCVRRSARTEVLANLRDCDYLLVGHDAAFSDSTCHIVDVFRAAGKRFGMLGAGLPVRENYVGVHRLYCRTLQHADFLYVRDRVSLEMTRAYLKELPFELMPDPAFGMRPAEPVRVDNLIRSAGIESLFAKPVVMVTSAEPAPIARHCFHGAGNREQRLALHRNLFAQLIERIIDHYDVNVLFLPHAIGPTSDLDDRRVARAIVERMHQHRGHVHVLESEYSARELKGLIARAALLIGERVHSMIGAVGVHTPFLCLGVREDGKRNQGIFGDVCGLRNVICYLNEVSLDGLTSHFERVWTERTGIASHLKAVSAKLEQQLRTVGAMVRKCIESARR